MLEVICVPQYISYFYTPLCFGQCTKLANNTQHYKTLCRFVFNNNVSIFQRTLICFAELTGVEPAVRRSTVYHTYQLYYSLIFYSFRDIVSHFLDIFHTILIVCYIRNITIHEIHLYYGHGQYINS